MNLLTNLPEFPILKPLGIEDHPILHPFLEKFPPYSDYNFASMWCYNTQEKMEISTFKGNLVVKFEDYITSDYFYSILGENELEASIRELLIESKKREMPEYLKLVPEIVADKIRENAEFTIEEDRDDFDYILSTKELSTLETTKYHTQKNHLNRFTNNFPDCKPISLNLNDKITQEKIFDVFYKWEKGRNKNREETGHELKALERFIDQSHLFKVEAIGADYKGELLGFMFAEHGSNGYSTGHFAKSDPQYKELYVFLYHNVAKSLFEKGFEYINIEQDLGIPGLRYAKEQWNPVKFLKKYTIKINE